MEGKLSLKHCRRRRHKSFFVPNSLKMVRLMDFIERTSGKRRDFLFIIASGSFRRVVFHVMHIFVFILLKTLKARIKMNTDEMASNKNRTLDKLYNK